MKIWWANLTFYGRPSYIFAKKLQGLKFFIKKWGRETYGSLQAEVDKLETWRFGFGVTWSCLDYTMSRFGFGVTWRK